MEKFSMIKTINFFNKVDINDKKDLAEIKEFLSNKEVTLFMLNNIEQFPHLSASLIYNLSDFTRDKEVAFLAISKDVNTLKHLPRFMFSNRQFMAKIAHVSKAEGINYIDSFIADDENIMKAYIEEVYINNKFKSFPENISRNRIANNTYKRVLKQISTDVETKRSFIEYYKNLEYLYYNLAKAYKRKTLLEDEVENLKILENKIQYLSNLAKEVIMEENELK